MCVPGVNLPCLYGIPVDRVVDEVGPDAAVVQQRVAFARSAVADDRFALAAWRRSGTRAASLGRLHLSAEGA